MAKQIFRLPDVGEGIAEAEVVAWHARAGDTVEEDAPLADVMTDKATVEITAPVTGRILTLGGEVGDRIAIGAPLVEFEIAEVAGEASAPEAAPPNLARPGSAGADNLGVASPSRPVEDIPAEALKQRPDMLPDTPPAAGAAPKVLASPAVRARAAALAVDLADVRPAGDRVRHADLDAYLNYSRHHRPAGMPRVDEQVKVIGLRRRIAENMAAAKRAIPHFTYVEEIDVTKLEALREDLNATRGEKPKLTMLPLLIVAIVKALPGFPMLNARYDDEVGVVTRHGAVHLGIATQTGAGLMVPVIRDAQGLNMWQLAGEIGRLAEAARAGRAASFQLSGSTLTLTSLGPLGGISTTPVINRPEVAIIGPNKVVERPVLRDGQVVSAKLMNLSISCDHRVVDGWDAASFVQAVKRLIETPALMLID